MNPLIKALTELTNLQRDRAFKPETKHKKKKKNSGFAEVLRKEREQLNDFQKNSRNAKD